MTTSKTAMSDEELQQFEDSYHSLLGFVSPRIRSRLAKGAEIDPELVRMQEQLRQHAMFPSCFDTKTAQLMLFGMLLVLDTDAARIHAWAAYRAGASWEE